MIIDAHVRVGTGRDVALTADELLTTMADLGIERAVVAPDERAVAVDNRAGNETVAGIAAASDGRLVAYAVANPWYRDAVTELAMARDAGARALAIDSVLQGFDLLDGLVDPLLEFAADSGWFVYVRTGTPPNALPLPLATLARRYPEVAFVMGRSGATDFWIDAVPALRHARNLYADTAYAPWDTVLTAFAEQVGPDRVVFSTDAPYTVPAAELRRVTDWPLAKSEKDLVLGGTLLALLGGTW